jgi:hypothetical protein
LSQALRDNAASAAAKTNFENVIGRLLSTLLSSAQTNGYCVNVT